MNEELDSQLSAMFDDELSPAQCELLARRLSRDEELRARWGRYAVIGAAIRAERGVRLNARVATRVSALVLAEPALSMPAASRRGVTVRWLRPLAGAAVAAGVAAASILWLRAQAPGADLAVTAQWHPVPVARATAPRTGAIPASSGGAPDSYVVPLPSRAPVAVVPTTELANYVVAHSVFSSPVARGNLLSAFMTSESGT
ncbi:MAG: sigma-E factor negative regulatory protein, partial [Steroidobacteraceae bacterium]